jgi:hypothetical protein
LRWTERYKNSHHKFTEAKSPAFFAASGDFTMKVNYPKVTSSNGLRRAIINFMVWEGHHLEATNTMGRPIDKRETYVDLVGRQRIIGSLEWQKGSGDLGSSDAKGHLKLPGHKFAIPLYVEIKYGKDKMSKDQQKYESKVSATGGVYVVIKNIDQWFDVYDNYLLTL